MNMGYMYMERENNPPRTPRSAGYTADELEQIRVWLERNKPTRISGTQRDYTITADNKKITKAQRMAGARAASATLRRRAEDKRDRTSLHDGGAA